MKGEKRMDIDEREGGGGLRNIFSRSEPFRGLLTVYR